jgi:hypothetical protein
MHGEPVMNITTQDHTPWPLWIFGGVAMIQGFMLVAVQMLLAMQGREIRAVGTWLAPAFFSAGLVGLAAATAFRVQSKRIRQLEERMGQLTRS